MYSNNYGMIISFPEVPDDMDQEIRMNWLKRFMPEDNIINYCNPKAEYVESWDTAFKQHVLDNKNQIDNIVVMHDDVVPLPDSDSIWSSNADIVCVRYQVPDLLLHYTWQNMSTFHNGFFRVKNPKEVFRMLPQPWWDWCRHPQTKEITNCNCQAFQRKAESYGYTFRNTGLCIHKNAKRWNDKYTDGPINTDLKTWQKRQAAIKKRRLNRLLELKK